MEWWLMRSPCEPQSKTALLSRENWFSVGIELSKPINLDESTEYAAKSSQNIIFQPKMAFLNIFFNQHPPYLTLFLLGRSEKRAVFCA